MLEKEMQDKIVALQEKGRILLEKIILTEKRNPTTEETSELEKMEKEISGLEKSIELSKKFQSTQIVDEAKDWNKVLNEKRGTPEDDKGKARNANGFDSFGDFLISVARAESPAGRFPGAGSIDPRLLAHSVRNAPSGMSANVPSDGGFLISPTRSNEIIMKTYEGGAIVSRCSSFEIGDYSDSLEVPFVDEDSRANGSRWGGLRAYREGEVDAPTSTKTKTGLWECRVSDLKALCYVTERLLNDAPAMESLIMELVPQEFTFKLEDEILNGTGGIQCKGIIGDTATVSITKEVGQAATTVVAQNLIKMWSRCWGKSRSNAAFFHNQDVEPQLFQLSLNVGTGGIPLFMPANGLTASPYATLFGRPLIPVEQAATLGTVGDITFGDFSQYALVRKGGLKAASSVHVKFIYDEMTFKFNMRVNGKPKWKNVLTPFKGSSNTLSPFVTVATRA